MIPICTGPCRITTLSCFIPPPASPTAIPPPDPARIGTTPITSLCGHCHCPSHHLKKYCRLFGIAQTSVRGDPHQQPTEYKGTGTGGPLGFSTTRIPLGAAHRREAEDLPPPPVSEPLPPAPSRPPHNPAPPSPKHQQTPPPLPPHPLHPRHLPCPASPGSGSPAAA